LETGERGDKTLEEQSYGLVGERPTELSRRKEDVYGRKSGFTFERGIKKTRE